MLDLLTRGGTVMYFILLASVISLAVILERAWYFWSIRSEGDEVMSDVQTALSQGRVLEAMQIARHINGPVGSLLTSAIAHQGQDEKTVREAVEKAGQEEVYRLEKGLSVMEMLASVSPLLGLLGTVTGIIKNFNVMGQMAGVTTPAVLSVGIAEALLTTAFGLIVAIPTLAIYTYFSRLVDKHLLEMNKNASIIISLVARRGEGA